MGVIFIILIQFTTVLVLISSLDLSLSVIRSLNILITSIRLCLICLLINIL